MATAKAVWLTGVAYALVRDGACDVPGRAPSAAPRSNVVYVLCTCWPGLRPRPRPGINLCSSSTSALGTQAEASKSHRTKTDASGRVEYTKAARECHRRNSANLPRTFGRGGAGSPAQSAEADRLSKERAATVY